MNRIAIIGSGTMAQQIAHYMTLSDSHQVMGFYDDYLAEGTNTEHGPVLGKITRLQKDFCERAKFDAIIIGIGYNHLNFRKKIFEELSVDIPFATFIHPSCYVDPTCKISPGVVALPGCLFDMNAVIGPNNFFNIGCSIAHDCQLRGHNFFGPSVSFAGFVQLGECCFLGIGTTAINNIRIANDIKTAASTTITKDIEARGLYGGIPARLLKAYSE